MTPLRNIARLSAAFLGSNLARAGIGFALSFILARGLGADGFGRWILCTAWASTLTAVLDLGFGVLLTRDGARDQADADWLLISALLVRLALGVPLAALLFAGAGYISHDAEIVAGLRVASLLGTAGAAYGCFGAVFRSQPRWLATVLAIETGWLALQCGGAWWLVMTGHGAGWAGGAGGTGWAGWAGWVGWAGKTARADVASLMVLALLVQLAQIVTAFVCWRFVFAERQQRQFPRIPTLWALLRRALPFAASGIVANLQTRVGPLMLGYLSTSSELGLYAAASRFGSVARLAPQAMFAGALPVLTQEHQRDRASAERVFRTFDMLLVGAAVAVAAGSGLFAAPVLRLVYGPSFGAAAPALFAVSVGLIPMLSNSGRKVFLYASGGETRVVRWSAVSLIVQVCVGAVLIPVFGGVAAAASLAVGEAIIWWPLRRSTSTPEPRALVTVASELSPTSPVS